ncbi:MAG: FecR domain-containing protein [Acidobacteriaceae bacterium]|nr:FecR domain-containing protein [Acidobacteriaceae bacterium]MBV8573022.1 FecR domain-containing protein [Acidobacteriaceae bacterium]
MKHDKLDQAVAQIRAESVDDETVRTAARRVFRTVFDSALLPEPVERIRGCADFQGLIPAYLSHSLTPARLALFEDHIGQCVACRRALRECRDGDRDAGVQQRRPKIRSLQGISLLPWAAAACLAAGITIGITAGVKGLLPGQHAVRATIVSVEGALYRVSGVGSSLVAAGTIITNADSLRTAKGSRAILRLVNGILIELDERSDVSLSNGWSGTGANLERGQMIVQTPEDNPKNFLVTAGDVSVPVRNAVFAIERGTKGTRIAVAKGSARVGQSQESTELRAGQQFATARLGFVPISTEFAWSQNADYYLSLLSELTSLQKQLHEIPSPGVRYQSILAPYLPEDTVLYAAIPNVGTAVAEAKRIFDERLSQSDVLRQWWQQQPAARDNNLDRALTQISSISRYLGEEIAVAVPRNGLGQFGSPIFLAQLRQSGLREYLESAFANDGMEIVSGSANPLTNAARPLFVCLDNGFAAASPDLQELRSVEETIANPSSGHFAQSPFFSRISQSYANGVGYVFAADMEQIVQKSVNNPREVPAGFNNAQFLVLERRDDRGGRSETRAALSFAGSRQGLASWLAAPAPMGSLDFVSPDAIFAAAVVMKNPRTVVNELFSSLSQSDPGFSEQLSKTQDQLGIHFDDDIAAAFGGDATIAVDGPLLPVPAWKFVAEVYDPPRLQQTVMALVDHYNQQATEKTGKLAAGSKQVNSRTFYWVRNETIKNAEVYYTFVDGYLLAGPSEGNLLQAIQNRQSGYTLASSSKFQNQLPADSYTNFSAIIYHNAGSSLGAIAGHLRSAAPLTPAQQQSLNAALANTDPGLICVYGETDRIIAVTKASFLGFNLGTLMGIAQGRPVVPLIASTAQSTIASARQSQQTRN